ncbi:MAG: hypothetical protein KatS3mg092_0326 [Patescibacteria group bacterium]|nr:MAG: hypothetical protein KatS3mg092_0326 [Patescibacteria group bacterium]
MKIKQNVGDLDKKVRIILGVITVFLATQVADWPRWVLLAVGLILIATGLIGFCGLYSLFEINTCRKK